MIFSLLQIRTHIHFIDFLNFRLFSIHRKMVTLAVRNRQTKNAVFLVCHLDRDNYMVTLGSVTEEQTKELRFRMNGPAVYTLQDIEIVEVSIPIKRWLYIKPEEFSSASISLENPPLTTL